MADVDAGMDDFANTQPALSPIQQVEQMIEDAEQDVVRHAHNLKASKALLRRLKDTLIAMHVGPGA